MLLLVDSRGLLIRVGVPEQHVRVALFTGARDPGEIGSLGVTDSLGEEGLMPGSLGGVAPPRGVVDVSRRVGDVPGNLGDAGRRTGAVSGRRSGLEPGCRGALVPGSLGGALEPGCRGGAVVPESLGGAVVPESLVGAG